MKIFHMLFKALFYIAIGALTSLAAAFVVMLCLAIPKGIENDNRFTQACSDSNGQVIRTRGQMICIKQDSILGVR